MPKDNRYSSTYIRYSPIKVIEVLADRFNEQEMILFCDKLREILNDPAYEYENLLGEGKLAKIRELVYCAQRRRELSVLVAVMKEERDDIELEKLGIEPLPSPSSLPPPTVDRDFWRSWWRWCVIIPLVMILVIWIYEKLVDTGDAYAMSFGHGDLLLFSALILFGVSVQLKTFERKWAHLVNIETLHFFKWFARAGAVLLLIFFNFMKHCMSQSRCLAFTPSPEMRNTYSGFTLSITTVSIAFGYYAYWKMKKQIADAGGQVSS
jgi:hypothetical protein